MKRFLAFICNHRTVSAAVMLTLVAVGLGRYAKSGTVSPLAAAAPAVAYAVGTFGLEQPAMLRASAAEAEPTLVDEGPLPDLGVAPMTRPMQTSNDKERFMPENTAWLHSVPLSSKSLRGKVVLIDFWTYSCINSLRNLPYVQSWAEKYKAAGLVVIGVHSPEFAFEKERLNVESAVRDLKVTYPVAIDSNYRIWQAFNNEYWPADYFIDGKGRIRHHFGEGDYAESERVIQKLLKENGAGGLSATTVSITPDGIEAAAGTDEQTPETYIGYRRAEHFASPQPLVQDRLKAYSLPVSPGLNQWGLGGSWNVGAESAVLAATPGKIVLRFHSRDVHLVLGPTKNGKPVRFKVKVNGAVPGENHGVDAAADGTGEVQKPRLYQLIRQKGQVEDRTFEIEFLDPGVHAYVFTFG